MKSKVGTQLAIAALLILRHGQPRRFHWQYAAIPVLAMAGKNAQLCSSKAVRPTPSLKTRPQCLVLQAAYLSVVHLSSEAATQARLSSLKAASSRFA
jgi:hypothetical protein